MKTTKTSKPKPITRIRMELGKSRYRLWDSQSVLTIQLKTKNGRFQWKGSNGYDYSPAFDNKKEAEEYPHKHCLEKLGMSGEGAVAKHES